MSGLSRAIHRGHWLLLLGLVVLATGAADPLPVQKPQPRQILRDHKGAVYSLSFSRDGKMLASSSPDWKVKLWNVETGKEP
jgi:WD40 repeat protein